MWDGDVYENAKTCMDMMKKCNDEEVDTTDEDVNGHDEEVNGHDEEVNGHDEEVNGQNAEVDNNDADEVCGLRRERDRWHSSMQSNSDPNSDGEETPPASKSSPGSV